MPIANIWSVSSFVTYQLANIKQRKRITVFLPCTRAQWLKVRALSENSRMWVVSPDDARVLPEKADPGPGSSPQRGAQGWGWRSLQVAPLALPLLQAPLYVPLLGTRHGRALQHSLHVPYLRRLKRGSGKKNCKDRLSRWGNLDDMVLTNSSQ